MTARDFWLSCGHHLLERDTNGRLLVTAEFLKVHFARPELMPPEGACSAERQLHAKLLANPRLRLSEAQVLAIEDPDAKENWQLMLAWRDHLLSHPTLEAAYLDLVLNGRSFPHLFIGQLVQVILRNILDGCEDAFIIRAAELFFRTQKLASHEESLISMDEETHSQLASRPASPLNRLLGLSDEAQIEVLSESNAASYFERSDCFDLGLDLTAGRRGLLALGELLVLWIRHLLQIEVRISPLKEIHDASFKWYVGLDPHATHLGDVLWTSGALDDEAARRLIGLFELQFSNPSDVDEPQRGAPVYVMTAMSPDMTLFLKPQNILAGLPLRKPQLEEV